ncbi:peptidoglycan recognition family protein, partial [Patescibacteria group bacterium]
CVLVLLQKDRGEEQSIGKVPENTENEENTDASNDNEDEKGTEEIGEDNVLGVSNLRIIPDINYEVDSPLDERESEENSNKAIGQYFEEASHFERDFQKTPVSTIQTIAINLRDSDSIRIVDIGEYEGEVFAFKWESGNFQYGLSDERVVPELQNIEVADDIDKNEDTLFSELIYLNQDSFLFIKPLGIVENLEIDIINPKEGNSGSFATQANHSSGIKYSSLRIIPREDWSGDPDINNPARLTWDPVYYKVDKVVVHHTATPNSQDPIYWMKAIYSYHTYTRGFGDIGYNYLIDQYGNIYEGKLGGEEAKGYHAGSANANSIGVSMIGTFSDVSPTQVAQDALTKLIAEKATFYDFTPGWHSTVYGHRDFDATACPGNVFYTVLPHIASGANIYKNSHFSNVKSVVTRVNDEVDNTVHRTGKLALIYSSPSYISLPVWSGISSADICDNDFCNSILTITINNSSSPYENIDDRLKTIYKYYLLQGGYKYIGLIREGHLFQ